MERKRARAEGQKQRARGGREIGRERERIAGVAVNVIHVHTRNSSAMQHGVKNDSTRQTTKYTFAVLCYCKRTNSMNRGQGDSKHVKVLL